MNKRDQSKIGLHKRWVAILASILLVFVAGINGTVLAGDCAYSGREVNMLTIGLRASETIMPMVPD